MVSDILSSKCPKRAALGQVKTCYVPLKNSLNNAKNKERALRADREH